MLKLLLTAISRSISHVPPAHFLLKIEAFSSLVENDVENYESLEFDAGGYKWCGPKPNCTLYSDQLITKLHIII